MRGACGFNSRLREEATGGTMRDAGRRWCFNSRLREEATRQHPSCTPTVTSFNSRLREEATIPPSKSSSASWCFNSRLREEATIRLSGDLARRSFNSRLREEATRHPLQKRQHARVSTHASVRRRRVETAVVVPAAEVSTHASVRRRLWLGVLVCGVGWFQLTPP